MSDISPSATSGASRSRRCLHQPALSAAGETSGISIRLMGAGKPVLMTAGLGNLRYSRSRPACEVDPGVAEEDMLREFMRMLARSPRTHG